MVVDGEPGAGKTTFMKMFCHLWSQDEEPAKKYYLLLAIILRLAGSNTSLKDIIKDQFKNVLDQEEVDSIIQFIETNPKQVCIILDGYDELDYRSKDYIEKLVTSQEYPCVTLVTTTRPHKIRILRNFNTETVQLHIKLRGFNQEQVKEYVKKYFGMKRQQTADNMISYIAKESYWKIARIPIRLEIMCFVWSVYGSLGSNLFQLYDKFVEALFTRMESRLTKSPKECTSYDKDSVFSTVADLANTFNLKGQFQTVFNDNELKEKLGNMFELISTFGCITEYHPSCSSYTAPWCFTHLSLQEFFIAKSIAAKGDDNLEEYFKHFSSVSLLEKHQLIIKFLCSIKPIKANKLVTAVMKKHSVDYSQGHCEEDCRRLLTFLFDILDHYENSFDADLPLPSVVTVDEGIDSSLKEKLEALFRSDRKHKNMTTLKIDKVDRMPSGLQSLDHVENLYMNVTEKYQASAKILLQNMTKLVCVHLVFSGKYSVSNMENLLQCLVDTVPSLSTLSVHGTGIIGKACDKLTPFTELKNLKIVDEGEVTQEKTEDLTIALAELNVNQLFIGCPTFNSEFMSMSTKANQLFFKIPECDVALFSGYTKQRIHNQYINMLDLSKQRPPKNKSTLDAYYGKYLADICISLPKLQVLKLRNSGITKETLESLSKNMKSEHQSLEELDLVANLIENGGDSLGKVLSYFPRLTTLLISLSLDNLLYLANSLSDQTNIEKLMIAGSDLTRKGEEQSDLSYFWAKMKNLTELYLVQNAVCYSKDTMQILFPPRSRFDALKVLYIIESNDTKCDTKSLSGCIEPLTQAVEGMAELEELHIPVDKIPVADIIKLTAAIPSSLQYLNLSDNKINILDILEAKDRLNNLSKFQIGLDKDDEEDIGIIRQDLSGTLAVYHDISETKLKVLKCSANPDQSSMDLQPLKSVEELLNLVKTFKNTIR